MSTFQVTTAKRENIPIKMLISGPSGAGKTYSALRTATGIVTAMRKVGQDSKIGVIDTEGRRSLYYADDFEFEHIDFKPQFSPERYIEAIDVLLGLGIKVIIIDSMSHEWEFCNDLNTSMGGNSWSNWKTITPRHNKFMEKILQCDAHIIATARGKDTYAMTEDSHGKKKVEKLGVGFKQRDNTEYEFTTAMQLAHGSHYFSSTKDNTHLFEERFNEMLTERDGELIYQWCNSGEAATAHIEINAQNAINKITDAFKAGADAGIDKEEMYAICVDVCGQKNYAKVKDMKILDSLYETLNSFIDTKLGGK